jgi:hypothetical protein
MVSETFCFLGCGTTQQYQQPPPFFEFFSFLLLGKKEKEERIGILVEDDWIELLL